MQKVRSVEAREGYRLWIEFDDGTAGEIDLSKRLEGPVFEPLKEPSFFQQVAIDEFGAIFWPNGADLAPDAVYLQLKGPVQTPQ